MMKFPLKRVKIYFKISKYIPIYFKKKSEREVQLMYNVAINFIDTVDEL